MAPGCILALESESCMYSDLQSACIWLVCQRTLSILKWIVGLFGYGLSSELRRRGFSMNDVMDSESFLHEVWMSWNMSSEDMYAGLSPDAFWYEVGVILMQSDMNVLCDMDSECILTSIPCASWHSFSMHHYTGSGCNLSWLPSALQHCPHSAIQMHPNKKYGCIL